ncbi:MAG: hypothetical protein H6610_07290 [Ignavibacteriales bacterium]|nr:hypothetical protein [Ignavibacteriales bacterium]
MWALNTLSSNPFWTQFDGNFIIDEDGIYGTKGVANFRNTPGGRNSSAGWVDSNGDFWLFGGKTGTGNNTAINTYFTDLWKYDFSN